MLYIYMHIYRNAHINNTHINKTKHTHTHIHTPITQIAIRKFPGLVGALSLSLSHTHTHTHTTKRDL